MGESGIWWRHVGDITFSQADVELELNLPDNPEALAGAPPEVMELEWRWTGGYRTQQPETKQLLVLVVWDLVHLPLLTHLVGDTFLLVAWDTEGLCHTWQCQ